MARKRKRTLAAKVGVSQEELSRKIARVTREDPSLTPSQAAGKAAGILQRGPRNEPMAQRGRKRRRSRRAH